MWVFTHTHPKSSRLVMRMARAKSFVHTLEANPYSTPLARRTASSSSVNFCTVITGPKISFWIISSSCFKLLTTVGEKKYPLLP